MRYSLQSRELAFVVVSIVAATLITLVLLDRTVGGALIGRITLPNVGTLKAVGVGVYWDSACSTQVASIDWGTIETGSTKNVTVYIENNGNVPVALFLETENWSPSVASEHISLAWDYAGQPIDIGEVFQVTLTLSVSESIQGITSFSFDIVVIGSG